MGQRMFVAVVPPESVRDDLTDFLEPRSRGALGASALRWIDREQWHITLAFFESVPDHRIDELAERLASAAQRRTPFDVALAGAGAFPSAARASVLWLGVTTGHIVDSGTLDALPSLATNARAAGSVVGAAPDGKSFHPHLTVARPARPIEATKWLRILDTYRSPTWTVDSIELVASYLGEGAHRRPRYETVGSLPLGGMP
ncbi:MAG: RNA 2',3'-cyclic phosphodiesterase [Actinomycetales bacterium]|jgi:2'-5' RNA ligase|nr:RNA 2',3'-cyclic phosphodiesterase [Actinomycetales bacterium]